MRITRIKVDGRLISLLIYTMAALGGYTPMLLLAGYVFLYEKDDERLRLDVLQAFSITIVYSLIKIFIGYVPIIINWFLVLTSTKVDISALSGKVKVITEIIEFTRLVLLIKSAVDAFKDNNRDELRKCFSVAYKNKLAITKI